MSLIAVISFLLFMISAVVFTVGLSKVPGTDPKRSIPWLHSAWLILAIAFVVAFTQLI